MSVSENIRLRRIQLGLSQQDLADAMGYKSRSTIAKIESGENDVSQKKLKKFADVLFTTAEELVSSVAPSPGAAHDTAGFTEAKQQKNVVIILAGGQSDKDRQNIPLQFVSVQGKPILIYCADAYQTHPSIDDIYIVCPRGWDNIVKAYTSQYGITKLRGLIPAGSTGAASLKNAFDQIRSRYNPEDLIFIQEATRPLVPAETISSLLQACTESGSATICHSMSDYVQFNISDGQVRYVDRNAMIALQSPEAHRLSLLEDIFDTARRRNHPLTETCCTMLMHHLGFGINFLQSSVNNIKISRNEDIAAFSSQIHY